MRVALGAWGLPFLLLAGCQTAPKPDAGSELTLESNYRLIVSCYTAGVPAAAVENRILRTGFAVTEVVLDAETDAAYRVVFTELPIYRLSVSGQAIGPAASPGRWGAEVVPAVNSCNERARRGDL